MQTTIDLVNYVNTSLVDVTTERIRNNILSGKYAPGAKLVVRELSDDLGVSHTPIKEALNRLVAEGYVEAIPRKSMVVKEYSDSDLLDILECRLMLERRCAEHLFHGDVDLKKVADRMEKQLPNIENAFRDSTSKRMEKWIEEDRRFHDIYVAENKNAAMQKMYRNLDTQRYSHLRYWQKEHTELEQKRYDMDRIAHLSIIEAIRNGKKDDFDRAITQHIQGIAIDHVGSIEKSSGAILE